MKLLRGSILAAGLWQCAALAAEFDQKTDVQIRFDDRSNSDPRFQYRLRFYPQLNIDTNWSINGFAVTGDSFASSHNTINSERTNYFYLRRLYLRHENAAGKTEVGVIPTYKGRVSSTGLSKDGWIKGLRHVQNRGSDAKWEVVLGQLDSPQASQAIALPSALNYVEAEYSASLSQQTSIEISFEHMMGYSYLRGEYRYKYAPDHTIFVEYIQHVSQTDGKLVLGGEGQINAQHPIEYFVYYAYVSDELGPRAELTEDFLGTGHGVSAELSSVLSSRWNLDWFVRIDWVNSTERLLGGVKWSW